jgi:hypothetical protein
MIWKRHLIVLLLGVFFCPWLRPNQAGAQSVYLNLTTPITEVMGGQSVIYNLVYGNTAVPVTTMDTFEADTVGAQPVGWVTYGGSTGTTTTETVITGNNGPTTIGSQAVSATFNYGCSPYCGRIDYTGAGPVTDGSIQADIYFPNAGNGAALMWRIDALDNQYQMTVYQGTTGNVVLVAQDNSPYQILTTASVTINAGQWYTVRLAVSGVGPVSLTGFVNGTQVAAASTTIFLGPGLPGIQVQGGSSVVFDNVQIVQSPDADGVNLTDTLPTGLTYYSSTGSPVLSGQLATWNLGNVIAGSAATVQLVATTEHCGGTFTNSAQLNVGAPSASVTSNAVTTMADCSPTPTPPAPGNKPYVYSNPSSGPTVNFVYNMVENGKADIRVWNASGVLAASLEDVRTSGFQQSVLNIQTFAPGHYFYQIDLKYDSGREDRYRTQVLAVQK